MLFEAIFLFLHLTWEVTRNFSTSFFLCKKGWLVFGGQEPCRCLQLRVWAQRCFPCWAGMWGQSR